MEKFEGEGGGEGGGGGGGGRGRGEGRGRGVKSAGGKVGETGREGWEIFDY